jgi:Tol biopolymer transport system component
MKYTAHFFQKVFSSLCLCLLVFLSACKDIDNLPPEPPIIEPPLPVYPRIDGYPAWSPDGKRIIYYHYGISHININGAYHINPDSVGLWMINADGTNPRLILKGVGECARWGPDGRWIAFVFKGQIYKAQIVGDKVDPNTIFQLTTKGSNSYPSWSPDGQWIAYVNTECGSALEPPPPNSCGILIVKSDGMKKRFVLRGGYPDWAPDGKSLIFVRRGNICRVNLSDTSQIVKLTSFDQDQYVDIGYPRCSPDGTKIVFELAGAVNAENLKFGIWLMNADGTNLKYLGPGSSPSWSPDGQKIVYIGSSGKEIDSTNGTVWVMNADGSDKRPLTYGPIPR